MDPTLYVFSVAVTLIMTTTNNMYQRPLRALHVDPLYQIAPTSNL